MFGRSGDRYLLAFQKSSPGRSLLGGVPTRNLGHLKLTLRDDATSHDVLTGVLQAACFRRLLASGCTEIPGWWRQYDGSAREVLEGADVDALLQVSHRTARRQAERLLGALQQQQWQMQPFMLSSTERAGYSVLKPGLQV